MSKKIIFISIGLIILAIISFLIIYNSSTISYYWHLLFSPQHDLKIDVTMYSNNGNDNAKEVEFLTELPNPDSIIFYYNGKYKTFNNESEEYKKIIELNVKRNYMKLSPLKMSIIDNNLKRERYLLEYVYEGKNSAYFNLLTKEELNNSNDTCWALIGYDSNVFKQYNYAGLLPADELIEYLDLCINDNK